MIFDKFEYKGFWWLPDNEITKVCGILKVSSDSIILELFGSFKTIKNFGLESYNIILGRDINGNDITLFKTIETKFSLPSFNSLIRANYVFDGYHFNQEEDIKFLSINIVFTYVQNWLNIKVIDETVNFDKNDEINKYRMIFTPPNNKIFKINSILSKLEITSKWKLKHSINEKIDFAFNAYLKITPNQEQNYFWYKNNINILRNLLILLIGYPIEIKSLKSYDSKKCKNEINIYEYSNLTCEFKDNIQPNNMLFSFPQLESVFENILNIWFELSIKFENVFKLFFETFYESVIKPNMYFLSLYLSLEGFIKQKFNIKKDIKYKIDELLNNKPFDKIFDDYIIDKEIFSKKVDVTRNFLIHFNKKSKYVVEDGFDLFNLSERIRLILTVYLFHELKISIEDINSALDRHQKFKRLKQRK